MKRSNWGLIVIGVAILLLVAGCPSGLIKVTGMVTGELRNEAGGPPPFVAARIVDFDSGSTVKSENVKDSGHFIISELEPGHYKLQVVDAGNREWRVDNEKAQDFTLKAGKTLDLGQITIYPPVKAQQ